MITPERRPRSLARAATAKADPRRSRNRRAKGAAIATRWLLGMSVAAVAWLASPRAAAYAFVQERGDSITSATLTPQDSALEAATTAVASKLRCPVCQGLSIQDSPSPLALEMRDLIKDQLRSGQTPDQVTQYFLAKYGEWILLEPKAEGFNVVVYALPVVALLGGLAIVWRAVRRWTSTPPQADEGPGAV